MEDSTNTDSPPPTNDTDDHKTADHLMVEYRVITQQIIHWDTFLWTKARFFLAFEGVTLLATVDKLIAFSR